MGKSVLTIIALFVTGCASPFVGDWQIVPPPSGAKSATLHLAKDGTYSGQNVESQGDIKAYAGQWSKVGTNRATLTPADGSMKPATLTLSGNDHLVFTAPDQSFLFTREETAR